MVYWLWSPEQTNTLDDDLIDKWPWGPKAGLMERNDMLLLTGGR